MNASLTELLVQNTRIGLRFRARMAVIKFRKKVTKKDFDDVKAIVKEHGELIAQLEPYSAMNPRVATAIAGYEDAKKGIEKFKKECVLRNGVYEVRKKR